MTKQLFTTENCNTPKNNILDAVVIIEQHNESMQTRKQSQRKTKSIANKIEKELEKYNIVLMIINYVKIVTNSATKQKREIQKQIFVWEKSAKSMDA